MSHCLKYARIQGFADRHFRRIRVSENPYSGIFYAVLEKCSEA